MGRLLSSARVRDRHWKIVNDHENHLAAHGRDAAAGVG
jgi:hypothetical protein